MDKRTNKQTTNDSGVIVNKMTYKKKKKAIVPSKTMQVIQQGTRYASCVLQISCCRQ